MKLVLTIFLFVLSQSVYTQAVIDNQYAGYSSSEKSVSSTGGIGTSGDRLKMGFTALSNYLSNQYKLTNLSLQATVQATYCQGSTGSIAIQEIELPVGTEIRWTGPDNFESTDLSITDLNAGTYSLSLELYGSTMSKDYEVGELDVSDQLKICRVTAETNNVFNRIWISDSEVYNAKQYFIYRESDQTDKFELIGSLSPEQRSFLDTGVDNTSRSYRYAIQLEDKCEQTSDLSMAHQSLFLQASVGITSQVNLDWTSYQGLQVSSYEIFRSVNNLEFERIAVLPASSTQYTDVEADITSNRYEYYVAVVASDCDSVNQDVEVISNLELIVPESQQDSDNDGIANLYDNCPNTPSGATVNAAGCEVFALPADTFSVTVSSATCPDASNGSITISSSNTDYSYRYAINDQAAVALSGNTQTISNLSAGVYTVCVTVDGVPDYERCYTIEITEPAPLVASSRVDVSSRNMQLDLSGSSEYQVTLNGKTFLTTQDRLSLNLAPGMNRVEVATALDCQGVYFEEIFVSEAVKVYPNPTAGPLQLFVAGSDKVVELSVATLSGNVVSAATLLVPANRIIETSLGNLPQGMYLITLNGTTVKTTHKVIKE